MVWRHRLKARVLLMLGFMSVIAVMQFSRDASSRDDYLPRLGDIMLGKQWRHIKLWFAGKQSNWDLAAYELDQLKTSLVDAATLYRDIPVSDVVTMVKPIQSIKEAIESKNNKSFLKAFNELTAGCNSCHLNTGRAFIAIQTPIASPFGDQSFTREPKKK
jgi:hypothetical protein